eukprot:CAMPEP_0204155164 /NCGR_PEP_ID=MMETSP0361-20130328/29353_1 /ASSEMBLY_ACC=CAM_ASM_000343 /TAXON_ID=268821 /ORGANISM="Scrippsiella Hangoei, Strain SHTV-5" /LENGTH=155 /DNA_ID=CAMNT_0051110579 /DNA_START=95 /DNA_END=559 /DNA_ORIENTATION=+
MRPRGIGNVGQCAPRLALFLHFHGSGGTSVCNFAKRAAAAGVASSGIRPDSLLATCQGLVGYTQDKSISWAHVETPLDLSPPCSGVALITALREPWARMLTEFEERRPLFGLGHEWPVLRRPLVDLEAGCFIEIALKVRVGRASGGHSSPPSGHE